MSRTCFRVIPHSMVAWMSMNSLLETGAKSEVKWLQWDSTPQPLSLKTNTQPFSQTSQMIELSCESCLYSAFDLTILSFLESIFCIFESHWSQSTYSNQEKFFVTTCNFSFNLLITINFSDSNITALKWSFPLRISLVNMVTFTEKILIEKVHFLCSVFYSLCEEKNEVTKLKRLNQYRKSYRILLSVFKKCRVAENI